MKPIIGLLFSFFVLHVTAQNNHSTIVNTQPLDKEGDSVYQAADFRGGNSEWKKFLERSLKPETAADHNAPAGVYLVVVGFSIDTAGNLIDIKILQESGYGTGDDVIHALSKSPQWLPATINGKAVKFRQKQNFTYQVTAQ